MSALREASFEELVEVDEIGDKIAEGIISFFKEERNRSLVDRLADIGLQMEVDADSNVQQSTILEGKSIVISGVFTNHSRNELKELIESNGGKNVGSLSSKTDYLLAGENMGPAKKKKAEDLGIEMISEEDFEKMISN